MQNENENEGMPEVKPKKISLIAMILAVIIELGFNLFYLIKNGKIADITDQQSITWVAAAVVIFFSPVYINMIFDKIVDIIMAFKKK